MKANELRIGNLVQTKNGTRQIVEGIIPSNDEIETTDCIGLPEDFDPIPLTEEWLERFGFFNEDGTGYVFESPKGISLSVSDDGVWYYMGNLEFLWVDILADIKYVHQLQNLYFALTGEELELKETVK